MTYEDRLLAFARREFDREARAGFLHLARLPDSKVAARIDHFRLAAADEQARLADCCAWQAHITLASRFGGRPAKPTDHPFFERWAEIRPSAEQPGFDQRMAVRLVREELRVSMPPSLTPEAFERAVAVEYVKAPELKKRARAALKLLGLQSVSCRRFSASQSDHR